MLSIAWYTLLGLAAVTPLAIYGWGRFHAGADKSRTFGHVASGAAAVGIAAVVLQALWGALLHSRGETPVGLGALVAVWFAFGSLWAGTRRVPFATLRTYPLLRRVWAILTIAGFAFAIWIAVKYTAKFLISWAVALAFIALVIWLVFKWFGRDSGDPPGPDGR